MINKKDKRALYESIIKELSRTVKKRVNEAAYDDMRDYDDIDDDWDAPADFENEVPEAVDDAVEKTMNEFNKSVRKNLCSKFGVGQFDDRLEELWSEMHDALVKWVISEM